MLRSFSLSLLTVALFGSGAASTAQTLSALDEVTLSPSTTRAVSVGQPSVQAPPSHQNAQADCADETTVSNESGSTTILGNGDTSSGTGTPQELGQSFTATCTGELQQLAIAVGNNFQDPSNAGASIPFTLSIYEGAGTEGTELFSGDFTATLPADGSVTPLGIPINGFIISEGSVYTFFVDATGDGFSLFANNPAADTDPVVNPYSGGELYISGSGNAEGAQTLSGSQYDLYFIATLGSPQGVAAEDGVAAAAELSAIRPNPTHDAGRFSLTVSSAQTVSVVAFDALGRQVATLYQGIATPGSATRLALDATRLAPGVYVVRAVGETFSASQTITVAR